MDTSFVKINLEMTKLFPFTFETMEFYLIFWNTNQNDVSFQDNGILGVKADTLQQKYKHHHVVKRRVQKLTVSD